MKLVHKFERTLRRYIEGFFNKKFSSEIEIIEIAQRIVEEMEDKKFIGVSSVYVPNTFSIVINKVDFNRIQPYKSAVINELQKYISASLKQCNYCIIGELTFNFTVDENLQTGTFRVDSKFSEPINEEAAKSEDTRVFKPIVSSEILKKQQQINAKLIVKDGPNAGMVISMQSSRINIGRRESNELPLTDPNTSRLHAYIVLEAGEHVLHDAKSLNGTYVNGSRIVHKRLKTNDCIRVGNTVIIYEVT